ncbi:sugar ABC transporter permease [Ruminococcus sp. CLA-AA-H200]|uniref:Sugar ABC transporter permease n=1 Tax=Ruminococcus turbiniformis TaxID=2881258 RepID=A0ABS8G1R7_9FIRM|nr:sugar ABC transporter permease [Ruminococcus turbiniformis]MCC2256260.1 sugar ABC transporter permease [Ruminococcus turbiniformis]
MKKTKKKNVLPYIYLTPAVIIIIAIFAIPLINLLWYSFARVDLIGNFQNWVGLKNYEYLLTDDFAATLIRTLLWVIFGITGIFIVGTTLALALNKPIPGRGFFRTVIIIPWVIPHVFAGTMWSWVLNSSNGIVNIVLMNLGLIEQPISFLGQHLAFPTVVFIRIWKGVPFLVMSLLSALQTIPSDVEEAAKLDGAIGLKYFRHITLPLLRPVMVMSGTILMAWSFTIFDLVYVITGGGPLNVTELLSITIYKKAFINSDLGGAAAIAIFTMVFVSIIAFFLMKHNAKEEKQ